MTAQSSIAAALPDYDIGEELGRGTIGVVFAARHRARSQDVAVKQLSLGLAADPAVRQRFDAEAQVLGSLRHAHIVEIYGYVASEDYCLLVMERLTGGTVWSAFRQGGFSHQTACAVMMATCAGLHHAHERGVLHRALKPENVLFGAERVPKLTDLGVAKMIGGGQTLVTKRGEVLGTPAYMAPELAGGREPGPTADVYAAGMMLFELLSGRLPYADDGGGLAVMSRHVYEDPVDIEDVAPEVPEPLADVTMRAIAPSADDRYQTAEEFGVALGEAAAGAWGPAWRSSAQCQIVEGGAMSEAATGSGSDGTGPPFDDGIRVHPVAAGHGSGLAPAGLSASEVLPLRETIKVPAAPLAAGLAAVMLLLAVGLAFVGTGRPVPEGIVPPGVVSVAGMDVAAGQVVDLDLAQPVEITVGVLPNQPAEVEAVQLTFSVGGAPLPASGIGFFAQSDGLRRTTVEATSARFLAGGELTGEVRLVASDEVVLRGQFPARPTGFRFLTVPGVVTVVLLVFLIAYAEVLLRPLRRGSWELSSPGRVAMTGAALGAALVPLGWMLGAPEPRGRTFLVCALFGAGSGVAAAVAARQAGARRRLEPRGVATEPSQPAE